jgi:GNAT superfamily N-acetyltransferase
MNLSETAFLLEQSDGYRLRWFTPVGVRDNSHVHHLFVAENHQKCGLARELWKVAREACLDAGNLGRFTVFSSKYALGVYRAFGFIESGSPEIKDGVVATPMTCVTNLA